MSLRIETKSALILLATFLLGGLVGLLTAGAMAQRRISRAAELRERGFADQIERIIEPRDDAQRAAVRAVLAAAADRNRETMSTAHAEIRASLERMREELEPLLDEEQRERLDLAAKRFRRADPPRRGLGPTGPRRPRPARNVARPPDSLAPPADSTVPEFDP